MMWVDFVVSRKIVSLALFCEQFGLPGGVQAVQIVQAVQVVQVVVLCTEEKWTDNRKKS